MTAYELRISDWSSDVCSSDLLRLAMGLVRDDALIEAYKSLARVSRIQAVMTLAWDVLATMTPSDYTTFRPVLGSRSGFQRSEERRVGEEWVRTFRTRGSL